MIEVTLPIPGVVKHADVATCANDARVIAEILTAAIQELTGQSEHLGALVSGACDLAEVLNWKLEELAKVEAKQ